VIYSRQLSVVSFLRTLLDKGIHRCPDLLGDRYRIHQISEQLAAQFKTIPTPFSRNDVLHLLEWMNPAMFDSDRIGVSRSGLKVVQSRRIGLNLL
jgi:hypothetical protein